MNAQDILTRALSALGKRATDTAEYFAPAIRSFIQTQQNAQKISPIAPISPSPIRAAMTDINPAVQKLSVPWMQGNPIKPEGWKVNPIDMITKAMGVGPYSPDEQGYFKNLKTGNMTPQQQEAGKSLGEQDALATGMSIASAMPKGGIKGLTAAVRLSPPVQLMRQATGQVTPMGQLQDAGNALSLAATAVGGSNLIRQGALGAARTILPNMAFGGGISALTGGSFAQGAGAGFAAAPQIGAVTKFTNPAIQALASKYSGKIANPLIQQLIGRGVTGAANIPEGMIINSALGRPGYSVGEAALDFGTGALFGTGASAKLNLADSVKDITFKHPNGKVEVLRGLTRDDAVRVMNELKQLGAKVTDVKSYEAPKVMGIKGKDVTKGRLSDVLYHGTDASFDEMRVGQPTKRRMMMGEYDTTSHGMFFTPDKKIAGEYGKNVGAYEVNVKNPLDFRDRKNDAIFNEFDRLIANDPNIDLKPGDPGFSEFMYFDGELGKKFTQFIKNKGFDGAKLTETSEFSKGNFDTIVALDNAQVKRHNPNVAQPPVSSGRLGDVKKGIVQAGNTYADLHGVDPESTITVYRGVKASQNNKLSGGEWVTQDRELARLYSRDRARASGEDARIISQKVKAKDLIIDPSTNPGVENEFRYQPNVAQPPITDVKTPALKKLKP